MSAPHVKAAPSRRVNVARPSLTERSPWGGIAGAVLVWAALNAALAMWLGARGLDYTDEGFYLNSMSHPSDDRSTILLFGYVYHPLYFVLGGEIVGLRWAGMALTAVAVACLAFVTLGTPAIVRQAVVAPAIRWVASVGLGVFSLVSLVQFPLTPSYNSLTEQGLAVCGVGVVLGLTRRGRRSEAGWMLLGVGGWLTFLGKPTSAAALIVLVVAVTVPALWHTPSKLLRGVAISATACLASGVATLGLARLSPGDLITILSNGLKTSHALGGHEQILRVDPFPRNVTYAASVLTIALVTGVMCVVVARVTERGGPVARVLTWALQLAVGAGLAVGAITLWWTRGLVPSAGLLGPGTLYGVTIVSVVGLLISALRRNSLAGAVTSRAVSSQGIILTAFLVTLPAAYAIGTNNNLWTTQGRAVVFPIIALTALLAPRPIALLAVPLTALTLLASLLAATAAYPYRTSSLLVATVPVDLARGGTMLLSHVEASHAEDFQRMARDIGFKPGTPVVDLTGDSPGYVYELGGRAVGQGWIIGGYTGSERAATLALEHDRCRLQGAWVLAADGSSRAIPSAALRPFGLDLARDFTAMGSFERDPARSWSHEEPPAMIYAPKRFAAQPECD